jgi:hypothetical protein
MSVFCELEKPVSMNLSKPYRLLPKLKKNMLAKLRLLFCMILDSLL